MLVDLLELLRLLLGNVQANREVIVVLDESLDCAGTVLQVRAEAFPLLGQLLHDVGDLDAIERRLTQLLVLAE